MITDIDISLKNLNREMSAIMDRLAIQAKELEIVIMEQPSRKILSDTKNEDIREYESITLSLEDELSSLTLECDKAPMILAGEFQVPSLVEKNELIIAEEPSLKEMQVEKEHSELIIENVLVRVKDFNFPIDSLIVGMEENRQVLNVERPSIATSQVWINGEHGEITLLIGEEKMKFDLHQSIL